MVGASTAGERLATALRTSQPAGVRSEVIAPGIRTEKPGATQSGERQD